MCPGKAVHCLSCRIDARGAQSQVVRIRNFIAMRATSYRSRFQPRCVKTSIRTLQMTVIISCGVRSFSVLVIEAMVLYSARMQPSSEKAVLLDERNPPYTYVLTLRPPAAHLANLQFVNDPASKVDWNWTPSSGCMSFECSAWTPRVACCRIGTHCNRLY